MSGQQQGSLSFGVKPYSQPIIPLKTIQGDQGKDWKQANVEVGFDNSLSINTTFQFVFEAVVNGAIGGYSLH